ncbi:Hypothetical predicted protein [Cloeon dipterum]|uniref:C-type lectin domain-containing protein n=1 Tax=Cloeon dipterum TaxID=197152 RepID=A0A8S1DY29_9INSE|nr:Hypothetical predicted protein [Cloeon dipterum]
MPATVARRDDAGAAELEDVVVAKQLPPGHENGPAATKVTPAAGPSPLLEGAARHPTTSAAASVATVEAVVTQQPCSSQAAAADEATSPTADSTASGSKKSHRHHHHHHHHQSLTSWLLKRITNMKIFQPKKEQSNIKTNFQGWLQEIIKLQQGIFNIQCQCTFWTSGSNEDLNCDTSNRYAWCSTGYEVSPTLLSSSKFWLSTNDSPSTLQRCMAVSIPLNSANKGMVLRNCQDQLPFVCQYSVDCPKLCRKNDLLFDSAGQLINENSYGFWINLGAYTYLFGNKLVTWLSNWQQCCDLGMEPLNMDNADEQTGLKGLTVRFKDDWKMNFNYWTSGTWQGSPQKMWSWCEPNGPTVFPPGLIWEAGQPDNRDGNETCVHFRFILNSTGAIMTDRNCTSKYVFACKCFLKCVGVEVGMFALGGLKSIETLRNIELVSQEEPKKLEQGFVAYDQCSGQNNLGSKRVYNSKVYYLSNVDSTGLINPIDAYLHCCALGLKLMEPATGGDMKLANYVTGTQTNPLVGEMEAINQTHEVWCRSRKVVPDNVYKSNAYRYICHQAIFLMVAASGVLDPMYYANGPGELIDAYLNRSNTYNFVQRFICEEP